MGSSTSKPRKGHKNPKHLPKVGTPENLEWRHQGERDHDHREREVGHQQVADTDGGAAERDHRRTGDDQAIVVEAAVQESMRE